MAVSQALHFIRRDTERFAFSPVFVTCRPRCHWAVFGCRRLSQAIGVLRARHHRSTPPEPRLGHHSSRSAESHACATKGRAPGDDRPCPPLSQVAPAHAVAATIVAAMQNGERRVPLGRRKLRFEFPRILASEHAGYGGSIATSSPRDFCLRETIDQRQFLDCLPVSLGQLQSPAGTKSRRHKMPLQSSDQTREKGQA